MRVRGPVLSVCLGTLLALPPSSPAQWANLGGPGSCSVFALAENGDRLFAATAFGIFVSTDGGTTWTRGGEIGPLSPGESRIHALYASGPDLFALSSGRLFRSTDGGAVWTASNTGLPEGSGALCLLDVGSVLYGGVLPGGLYQSTDRGSHWLPTGAGLPDGAWITDLAALGQDLYALDNINDEIYRSTDGGASWTAPDSPLSGNSGVDKLVVCGRRLFLVAGDRGIFSLEEGTEAWKKVELAWDEDAELNFFGASGQALLVHIGPKCQLSLDGGASWKEIKGLPDLDVRWVSCFVASGPYLFVGIAESGLYRSGDLGASWTPVGAGFPSQADIPSIARLGTDLFAAARDWGSSDRLFRKGAGSAGWEPIEMTLPEDTRINCLTAAGPDLIVGTNIGLFLSDDQGRTWTAVGPTPEVPAGDQGRDEKHEASVDQVWVNDFADAGSRVLAGTVGGILLSEDRGRTWIRALPASLAPEGIDCFAQVGVSLFAGGRSGLFVTKDNGLTWRPVLTNLPNGTHVVSLATDGKILMAAIYPRIEEGPERVETDSEGASSIDNLYAKYDLLVSRDDGRTWKPGNKGLPGTFKVALLAAGPSCFIASLENNYTKGGREPLGLFLSKDGGATWTSEWPGRWTAKPINGFLFETDGILAATSGAGIWRLPLAALKEPKR